jgi:ABC-type Zn uptake system ZnuABC Zn-binding protein ZnuA
MKKSYILLLVTLFALSIISSNATADEETTNIICTNSVLADFSSNLISENATIDYIMPSGVCPAYYDTTPSDVSKIINADIIISFGNPFMEPWLGDLLAYNENYQLIECKDMGEWNVPDNAKNYVEHISEGLCEILPDLNLTIKQNEEEYKGEIDQKALELKTKILENDCIDKQVIAMSWQKDFLEFLELNVTYSYGPPQGLSAQDEIDVITAATNNEIYAIIDNLQSGTDFGARVASESGSSHIIFTNFPGAIPGTDTYLDMIDYNTEQLIKGIETYEYKQGTISSLNSQINSLELQRNISIVFVAILAFLVVILFLIYVKNRVR